MYGCIPFHTVFSFGPLFPVGMDWGDGGFPSLVLMGGGWSQDPADVKVDGVWVIHLKPHATVLA